MSLITADELRDVLDVGASVGDSTLERILDAAERAVLRYLKTLDDTGEPIDYSTHGGVLEAIVAVAVDFYGARNAPGGVAQGVDFAPAPTARLSSFYVQKAVQAYALDAIDPGAWVA